MDGPAFEGKAASQAGRHLARHGCGLDGDGARAAHGIHEWQRGIVFAQGQKASGQGFAQGRASCLQTPAAAVQQRARSIDADGEAIVLSAQKDTRAVVVFGRLGRFLAFGQLAHAVGNRQCHGFCQGAGVVQAAVAGRHVDAQGPVARDVAWPRQLGQASAQRREVAGLDLAHASTMRVAMRLCRLAAMPAARVPENSMPPSTTRGCSITESAANSVHRGCSRPGDQPRTSAVRQESAAVFRLRARGFALANFGHALGPAGKAQVDQDLDGPTAASHGRIHISQQLEAQTLGFGAKGFEGALAQIVTVDLAVLNQVAGQFELRLDQDDAFRACAQPKGQPAQHASRGHEADIHGEKIERSGRHIQRQGFEVGALQAGHAPVASQIG